MNYEFQRNLINLMLVYRLKGLMRTRSYLKLNYSFIYHNHEGDMSGGCHFETQVARVEDGALSANTNNLHP